MIEDKNAVVIDIDGTIANLDHRLHYIKQEPKNYDKFNSLVLDDSPIKDVIWLINIIITAYYERKDDFVIFICSGRPEDHRDLTEQWLKQYVPRLYDVAEAILLRPKDDFRADTIIKMEMKTHIEGQGYKIRVVFDDRQSVVDSWR